MVVSGWKCKVAKLNRLQLPLAHFVGCLQASLKESSADLQLKCFLVFSPQYPQIALSHQLTCNVTVFSGEGERIRDELLKIKSNSDRRKLSLNAKAECVQKASISVHFSCFLLDSVTWGESFFSGHMGFFTGLILHYILLEQDLRASSLAPALVCEGLPSSHSNGNN